MELVLGRVLESELVKGMLVELKGAVLEANRIEALMMPKYEALINEIEWVVEDEEDMEIEKCYNNAWILSDASHNELMVLKNKLDAENGYELELGYCPILIARSKERECYEAILAEIVKVVPSMANVKMHMANYENLKRILRGLAGIK